MAGAYGNMEEGAATGFFLLYAASGFGSCIWFLLMFYNLISLIQFMRSDTDGETASGLSKAAWAVGFLSFLLGPCMWFGAVIALIMSKVERGRIYTEVSSFASSTPCTMGSINGGVTLVMYAVFLVGALAGAFL